MTPNCMATGADCATGAGPGREPRVTRGANGGSVNRAGHACGAMPSPISMRVMLRALPRAAFALAALTTTLGLSRAAGATASAELYSQAGYRYGRFRARVQFPAGDGIVGSFFLWKDGSEVAGVFGNELDFEKIGADCAMQLNAIFGNPPAMHPSLASGLGALCAGYHTYMYEWTPDHIAWSVDDVEVRRQGNDETSQAYRDQATQGMQFRFNLWPGTPALGGTFSPSELPAHEFVSWVEYATYTPGAGDDGGDFSFAWRESFEQGIPVGWAVGNWASHFGLSTHSPLNVTFTAGIAVLSLTDDNALGFGGVPPVDDGDLPSQRGPLDAGVRDASARSADARSEDTASTDAPGGVTGSGETASGDAGAPDGGTAPVDDGSVALEGGSLVDAADAGASIVADAPMDAGASIVADAPMDELIAIDDGPALADAAPSGDVLVGIDASIGERDSGSTSPSAPADAAADGEVLPPARSAPESGCGCRIASTSSDDRRDGGGRTALALLSTATLALATRRPVRRRRKG